MGLLTREELDKRTAELASKDVPVDGGELRLLEWDGVIGDEYAEMLSERLKLNGDGGPSDEWRCKVLTLCIVDDENKLMFDRGEWTVIRDRLRYRDKTRLYVEAMRMNGIISDEDESDPN